MKMKRNQRRAFLISSAIHVAFFLVLLAGALLSLLKKNPPPPHVFTLSTAPLAERTVTPPARVEPIQLPPARPVTPAPDPPPRRANPAPPKPAPATPEPTPPPPKPKPKPKPISIDEFRKKHGRPSPPAPKQPAPKPKVKVQQVDTQDIKNQLNKVRRPADPGPSAPGAPNAAAVQNYFDKVRSMVAAAKRTPANLSGLALEARVQFDILADGRVANFRWVKRSGNPDYDRSVQDAISRVGNFGPPPGGKPLRDLILPFRGS